MTFLGRQINVKLDTIHDLYKSVSQNFSITQYYSSQKSLHTDCFEVPFVTTRTYIGFSCNTRLDNF